MNTCCWYASLPTPLGAMRMATDGRAILELDFDRPATAPGELPLPARAIADALRNWLEGYFSGVRPAIEVPLAPHGTLFQREVWGALRQIPYGETASYGEIAARIGRPSAVRAVGAANGRNPIAILIPCHRVIGVDGTLTGYAGGLDRKRALLALEAPPALGRFAA